MALSAEILDQLDASLAVGSSDCSDKKEIAEKLSEAGVKTYGWEPVGTEEAVYRGDFAKAVEALGLKGAAIEVEASPSEGIGAETAYISGEGAIGARLEFVLPESIPAGGGLYEWLRKNAAICQEGACTPGAALRLEESGTEGHMEYVPDVAEQGKPGIEFSLEKLVKRLLGIEAGKA